MAEHYNNALARDEDAMNLHEEIDCAPSPRDSYIFPSIESIATEQTHARRADSTEAAPSNSPSLLPIPQTTAPNPPPPIIPRLPPWPSPFGAPAGSPRLDMSVIIDGRLPPLTTLLTREARKMAPDEEHRELSRRLLRATLEQNGGASASAGKELDLESSSRFDSELRPTRDSFYSLRTIPTDPIILDDRSMQTLHSTTTKSPFNPTPPPFARPPTVPPLLIPTAPALEPDDDEPMPPYPLPRTFHDMPDAAAARDDAVEVLLNRPGQRMPFYRRARDVHSTKNGYMEKKIRLRRRRGPEGPQRRERERGFRSQMPAQMPVQMPIQMQVQMQVGTVGGVLAGGSGSAK